MNGLLHNQNANKSCFIKATNKVRTDEHNIVGPTTLDLVSHTAYIVCIDIESTSNDRLLRNFLTATVFHSQSFYFFYFFLIAEEKFFFIFFWCLACGSNPGFTSNKPTHYLLGYSSFQHTSDTYDKLSSHRLITWL